MTDADLKKIASTNPGIDAEAIERLVAACEAMRKAGLAAKHEYGIEPPLGRKADPVACLAFG